MSKEVYTCHSNEVEIPIPQVKDEALKITVEYSSALFITESPKFSSLIVASQLLRENITKLPEKFTEGRRGGVLGIAYRDSVHIIPPIFLQLGNILEIPDPQYKTKAEKYTAYIKDKIWFLLEHPKLETSGQNLDLPSNKRRKVYGSNNEVPAGAIALPDGWVIAYSGYKNGEMDECIALAFRVLAGLSTEEKMDKFANKINNPDWLQVKNILLS